MKDYDTIHEHYASKYKFIEVYDNCTIFYDRVDTWYNFVSIDKHGKQTKESKQAGYSFMDSQMDEDYHTQFGDYDYFGVSKKDF